MAYEEDFISEEVAELAPEALAPDAAAADPTTAPAQADVAEAGAAEVGSVEQAPVGQAPPAPEGLSEEAPADVPAEAPTGFDEATYLKAQFGDDAPATATELRERLDAYRANQLTDPQRAQLALLADPTKLAAYAALSGKDYDAPTATQIMRERFALDHPDMNAAQQQRRFARVFAEKYPTLAAALDNPDDYDDDDPTLLAEREDADYDARADRTFLKTNQQSATQAFLAAAQASTAPQFTPEQVADAQAVVKWADETFSDTYALPIDLGNGQKINMPIGNATAFKAAFTEPDKLYTALVQNENGQINREMQAKIALFLSNPKGYDAYIANAVKSAAPPALTVADLANSSARQARPAAAKATTPTTPPVYADEWMNSNA